MTGLDLTDTIAAVATPPGRGGIGVVRLSGRAARTIAGKVFAGARLTRARSHTLHLGRVVDPESREEIDQVLAAVFVAPHSYTGEDVVEFSCHGGDLVVTSVLGVVLRQGARLATPGEFTRRAVLSGRLDLVQAEAVQDLVGAVSDQARHAALRQLRGELSRAVRELAARTEALHVELEAAVQFPEDAPVLDPESRGARLERIGSALVRLIDAGAKGLFLRSGAHVVICGRANVGKSSLFNRLLGEPRALVAASPGTTRDVVEGQMLIAGRPIHLYDTAGQWLRRTLLDERSGLRARRQVRRADFVLAVFDSSRPLAGADRKVLALARRRPHLLVLNKQDLAPRLKEDFFGAEPVVSVSCRTGAGIRRLRAQLTAAFGSGDGLVTNVRHLDRLRAAHESIRRAAQSKVPEIGVLELASALGALGEITGETAPPDVLDRIFGSFCIGK